MCNSSHLHALTPIPSSLSHNSKFLIRSRMYLPWVVGILLWMQATLPTEVVKPGPPAGIFLQELPVLLINHCRLYTQRFYKCLDPWDIYCTYIYTHITHTHPPKSTEGGLIEAQTNDTIEHAKQATIHALEQLDKFLVAEKELSNNKRPKRFLGALLAATAKFGSCFHWPLSCKLCQPWSTPKAHGGA